MKKIFYTLLISFLLQIMLYSQSGWVAQNSGTNQDLWAIHFLDQNKGWAAGVEGTLIKTTNGGTTWTAVTTNTDAWFSSIFFLDQNFGWVVGPDYTVSGSSGCLLKTSNGGLDWALETFQYPIFKVIFIDQNIGWAVGFNGETYPNYYGIVWKTTNGGETWIEKTSSFAPSSYWDMCFVNETTGWVVGENSPNGLGIIKKTTDGGETWIDYTNPFQGHLETIVFNDDQIGWILGDYLLLHTTNSGEDWFNQNSSVWGEDMFFVDENVGWIARGYSPSILKTTDAGVNWFAQNNPTSRALNSIFFLNNTKGWIVGYNGTILHTTNGGYLHFVNLLLPNGGEEITGNSVYEITWASENVDSVNIYLSLDNGASWSDIVIHYPSYNSSNNGFVWNVPDTTSDQCLVKIEDSSDPSIYDLSDQKFSIVDSTTSVDLKNEKPNEYALTENYPNPFNPTTTITYQIPERGFISIKVYDILGREVATLVNEEKSAGSYEVQFSASGLTNGIYFYQLLVSAVQSKDGKAGEYSKTKKMILLK